jgi:hypothetical protein
MRRFHQHDGGMEPRGRDERLLAVGRLADDFQIRMRRQERAECLAK